jgi:hypothetical protein
MAERREAVAEEDLAWSGNFMRPEDLRAFAQRDWGRAERAKLKYWTDYTDTMGAGAVLRVADALREHVKRYAALDGEQERARDLEHHIQLKRRIDAASRQFRR